MMVSIKGSDKQNVLWGPRHAPAALAALSSAMLMHLDLVIMSNRGIKLYMGTEIFQGLCWQ